MKSHKTILNYHCVLQRAYKFWSKRVICFISDNEKDEKSNASNEEMKKDGGSNPWCLKTSKKDWV